ncbi:DUF6383 domain-containing protein [Parabacteroides sp.]
MNKRFSTLLATALVAGSLSAFAADATIKGPGTGENAVKDGELTYLYAGTEDDADVIVLNAAGELENKAVTELTTLATVNSALWKVTVIKSTSVAGGNTYKFQNKATGKWLSVDLKSNTKAAEGIATSTGNVKVGGSNSVWGWDDTKGLYAVVGDTTFCFKPATNNYNLLATHKDKTVAGNAVFGYTALDKTLELTADEFNTLTKGKLYFNGGKDVSTGNTNVLTANTWKAVEAIQKGTNNANFGGKRFSLKNTANKYLVVDTVYYDGTDDALKLTVDTVYAKDYTADLLKDDPANKRAAKSYRFSANWNVAKDSLIILMDDVPAKKATTDATGSDWAGNVAEDNGAAIPSQIVLRNLANATVLTTGTKVTEDNKDNRPAYEIQPLIQGTPSNMGGIAIITPNKVYYVADMRGYADGKVNANNGKFYDYNTVNMTHYLEAGQAFNYLSQFVVTATPGTDKGNYIIQQRATGDVVWAGIADSLANGNIVIATETGVSDTIKLVDANIAYAGATQYIGYHATDHALKNKQFKIQSASPLLSEEMFIHMKKDSSMTLKAGEVMYNLVRLDTRDYNDAAIKDAVDKLAWDVYAIKTSKGEYLVLDNNGNYILTADPAKYNFTVGYKYTDGTVKDAAKSFIRTGFAFIPTDAADKYVIMPTFPCVEVGDQGKKLAEVPVSCYYSNIPKEAKVASGKTNTLTKTAITASLKQSMATVNTNTGDLENEKIGAVKYDLFYVAEEDDPQSLFTMPKHIQMETTNNQFVTINAKNEALVVAENALKAANYTTEDFTFWLDTAAYNRNGEVLVAPSYYVTRGVAADTTAKVEAHRLYMYNAADSAKNATVDKEQYTAYESTRVIFREALRYGADSLVVAGDTLTLDGKAPKTSPIAKPKAGVNNFRFNFLQAKDEAAGVYNIKCGDDYLRNLNGVLVIGKLAEAVKVTVNAAEAPTANEGVEVAGVKVIAGEGSVQIAGAQGKKVVISNILGQVVANMVIASDNAVIAAPQGVVVVAVEGEDAVKAIVK